MSEVTGQRVGLLYCSDGADARLSFWKVLAPSVEVQLVSFIPYKPTKSHGASWKRPNNVRLLTTKKDPICATFRNWLIT